MRIGNWLGWFGDQGVRRRPGSGRRRAGRRASHDDSPGWFAGEAVRRPLLRRLRPDPVRRRAHGQDDRRQGRRAQRAQRRGAGQRPGHRLRPARMVHLQGRGRRRSPTRSRPRSFRSGRAPRSPGTSITGRPRPTRSTSPGPAATGGSTRLVHAARRRRADPHSGQLHPAGEDIVLAGPNGLLETLPPAGDDATWFPNLYDDLTWVGPDKEKGGEITIFQTPSPLLKYDQLFGTSARQWEAVSSQNKDISRWPGHCLGGAVASILLNEPIPAPGRA